MVGSGVSLSPPHAPLRSRLAPRRRVAEVRARLCHTQMKEACQSGCDNRSLHDGPHVWRRMQGGKTQRNARLAQSVSPLFAGQAGKASLPCVARLKFLKNAAGAPIDTDCFSNSLPVQLKARSPVNRLEGGVVGAPHDFCWLPSRGREASVRR